MTDKLAVFDIDGTISSEGRDSWYELTEKLVTDSDLFQRALINWKEKKASDPYGESLTMMETAISLFPEATTSNDFKSFATQCFSDWIKEIGFIRDGAIQAIHRNLDNGNRIVFATTSYKEAGEALVDVLKMKKVISNEVSIDVTGTEVNWSQKKLDHFNMGDGKLEGVSRVLGMGLSQVKESIEESFGDDPSGNDSGILKYGKKAFIISTKKNQEFNESLLNAERLQW